MDTTTQLLDDGRRVYREVPTWSFATGDARPGDGGQDAGADGLGPALLALTFVFATRLDPDAAGGGSIRLDRLDRRLRTENRPAWEALVDPVSSFLSDIAAGGLGRRGRPLIFTAEPARDIAEGMRPIRMLRPPATVYSAERRNVELLGPDEERGSIAFELRDAFALFESGHLFYLPTLVPTEEGLRKLDEYALIQLQKLVNPDHEATDLRRTLGFVYGDGKKGTLIDALRARMAELARPGGRAPGPPNAVRDILRRHVLAKRERLPDLGWDDLKFLFLAIQSDRLKADAVAAAAMAASDAAPAETKGAADGGAATPAPGDGASPPPHLDRARTPDARTYVLAGCLQGVLDFPFQDRSELLDSFEPVFASPDVVVFGHPRFLIEIGGGQWRSLRDMRDCLGTCPYLALAQCQTIYSELLLDEVEGQIDSLLYDGAAPRRWGRSAVRVASMSDLIALSRRPRRFPRSTAEIALKRNLRRRVRIFRDLLVFRPANIFRYKSERELYDGILKHRRLDIRYTVAVDLLDRYEQLVKDTHDLQTLAANRRFTLLLTALAVAGFVSALHSFNQLFDLDLTWRQSLEIMGVVVGLVAVWLMLRPEPD